MKKKRTTQTIATFLLFCVFALGCSTGTKKDENPKGTPTKAETGASIEAKQVGAQIGSAQVVEIQFAKGRAEIAPAELKKIETGIARAEKALRVRRVEIVAWSDFEMPAADAKELDQTSVNLAEARADRLERELKARIPKLTTDRVNMAKRASEFDKFLKTKDARIQEALQIAGVPTTAGKAPGEPKASRAILIFGGKSL